jgi:hypothetical protein
MPVPVDVIRFAFWREEFMRSGNLLQPLAEHKRSRPPEEIQKYDGIDRKFEGRRRCSGASTGMPGWDWRCQSARGLGSVWVGIPRPENPDFSGKSRHNSKSCNSLGEIAKPPGWADPPPPVPQTVPQDPMSRGKNDLRSRHWPRRRISSSARRIGEARPRTRSRRPIESGRAGKQARVRDKVARPRGR